VDVFNHDGQQNKEVEIAITLINIKMWDEGCEYGSFLNVPRGCQDFDNVLFQG